MRTTAPPVEPEPGWEPVRALRLEGGRGSFVSGDPDGDTLRVAYFRDAAGTLVGRVWFGPGALGPPGHAHGGSMAAVLDEAMGAAVWMHDRPSVAVNLNTDFRRMLPLGTDAYLEARIERTEGRKVYTSGRLHDGEGTVYCEATGLFLHLEAGRDRGILKKVAEALGIPEEELARRFEA